MRFLLPTTVLASARLVTAAPKHVLNCWRVRLPSSARVNSSVLKSSQMRQFTMSFKTLESPNSNSNNTEDGYLSWWWPEHDVSLSGVVKSIKKPHLRKGVDPWGFVIYRCTYGNDEAWKRMIDSIMTKLKGKATDLSLNTHPGEGWDDIDVQDLLPRHELTLIEDRDKFDGATSHEVRDYFIHWVKDELIQKRMPNAPEEIHRALINCPPDKACPAACLGPRYNFCLFVDDICLESLDEMSTPVMKILWKQRGRREPNDRQYDIHPDWEDGETDDWEEDVGWMYIQVDEYFKFYDLFDDDSWWYDFYSRPPYMLYSGLSFPGEIPGSWRPVVGRSLFEIQAEITGHRTA